MCVYLCVCVQKENEIKTQDDRRIVKNIKTNLYVCMQRRCCPISSCNISPATCVGGVVCLLALKNMSMPFFSCVYVCVCVCNGCNFNC